MLSEIGKGVSLNFLECHKVSATYPGSEYFKPCHLLQMLVNPTTSYLPTSSSWAWVWIHHANSEGNDTTTSCSFHNSEEIKCQMSSVIVLIVGQTVFGYFYHFDVLDIIWTSLNIPYCPHCAIFLSPSLLLFSNSTTTFPWCGAREITSCCSSLLLWRKHRSAEVKKSLFFIECSSDTPLYLRQSTV